MQMRLTRSAGRLSHAVTAFSSSEDAPPVDFDTGDSASHSERTLLQVLRSVNLSILGKCERIALGTSDTPQTRDRSAVRCPPAKG